MTKLVEIDERVGIFKQMEEDVGGPVILLNKFSVSPEEFEQFLEGWAAEAEKFKEQPGFISTQLHKGMGVAVPSLTMQFGNRQDISRGRSIRLWTHNNATESQNVID